MWQNPNLQDFNLPSCWDRADGGLTSYYGTPAPVGTILLNYNGGPFNYFAINVSPFDQIEVFEESSDSPTLEFGEQCTIVHTYFTDFNNMQAIQTEYQRGFIMYDNTSGPFGANVSRVLSTNAQPVSKTAGLVWRVAITSEAQSFANPPEEISYDVVELNPAVEKHPRYSDLTYLQRATVRAADISDFIDITQQATTLVATFPTAPNGGTASPPYYPFQGNQQGEALELLFKKQRGEDSFYLSGYKIQYSKYFWQPQDINPGGYIEDPFTVIPYQYWTDGQGNNIFQNNAIYNPNLYPNAQGLNQLVPPYGLSWLRQTDTQTLNRTWYKNTMTWIGGTLAQWDKQWYSPFLQPLQNSASYGSVLLA
jgi:hypothetical protein